MGKRLLLVLLFLAFVPFVSAEISIGQPDGIYNIDEELLVDVVLNPSIPTNDFLTMNIGCGNESVEIYKAPFNLGANEEEIVEISALLSHSLIGPLEGQCNLVATYGGDEANSQSFEITNKINIELNLEGNRYNPGEEINVNGIALRRNGALVNGFIDVSIDSLSISLSSNVIEGEFSFNFTLSDNTKSGEHNMTIFVHEEDGSGGVSNEGSVSKLIEITQILNKIEISLSNQNIFPEEDTELLYTISAYDQSEDLINEEISLVIYEPGDFVFLEKVVNSGDENSIELDLNYLPGYWKIEATSGELISRKLFYIEETEKIQSSLINDTLIVTNIGNVEYVGPIEVSIGSSVQVKQLKLEVGETKKFRLYAPDGTYLIGIDDGVSDVSLGNVALTGNAIRIEDIGEGFIGSFSQPILWLFAIILLIVIMIYVHVKRRQSHKEESKGLVEKEGINKKSSKESVMYGIKEDASIVALKVEGKTNSSYISSSVEKALTAAKNSGAKVYIDGDYKIILLSPSLTKKKHNEDIAVKIAKRIEGILGDHNKRFKDKIKFGVGVSNGGIISEKKGSEFKFTTVGNVISKAKRIAQGVGGQALLSDSIRRAISGGIKVEKTKEKDIWRVVGVADREKHSDFLRKFSHKK